MAKEQYQLQRSQVQRIRDAVDIHELISEYVPLKKAGVNFKGLCPFHKEKTPSFIVSRQKQIYHCFGCGVGGNAFDFLMQIRNIDFKEALSLLADRTGIELQSYRPSKKDDLPQRLFRVNGKAMEFYSKSLLDPIGKDAQRYLKLRGLDRKDANEHKLGFSPDRWDSLVRYYGSNSVDLKDALKAGLIIEKKKKGEYYDRFRNRLMFPIIDFDRNVIGFGGRTLGDDRAKYINSPESSVFPKRSSFYGLDRECAQKIRDEKGAIIVEGYMDLIALKKAGFGNTVATLGTAFTMEHAKKIKRFTDNVYITFDSDSAGLNATKRVLSPVMLNSLSAKVIMLPSGHDPDSFIRKEGSAAFRQKIDKAQDLIDFYIKNYFEKEVGLVGRARVLEEIKDNISKIPKEFEKELIIKRLCELTGIKEDVFRGSQQEQRRFIRPEKRDKKRLPKEELLIIKFILEDNDLASKVGETDILEQFSSDELRKIASKALSLGSNEERSKINDSIDAIEDPLLKGGLREVLLNDTGFTDDNLRKAFDDCCRIIRGNFLRRKNDALKDELLKAERNGDEARSRELLKEINSLKVHRR